MSEIEISIDPGRILFGLSKIGYTPASAICDIIDNAVMAGAKNISVLIHKEQAHLRDSRAGNVKEYVIVDDGKGMNEQEILNALKLGSSDHSYSAKTLSKFGLGLKSASFSQGDILELISSNGAGFKKYSVSLPLVVERKAYFAMCLDLDDFDNEMITEYLPSGKGTIVRIREVRKEGHPSINQTVQELNIKVGVIYYYYMTDEGVKITIDSIPIPPYDVLFSNEADVNGNLDENEWDGKSVKWIKRTESPELLDADSKVKAVIQVTQLPHPPTFGDEERGGDKKIREKYNIGGGNQGYYVYRNKRLISWAERFNIIPLESPYYGFRGRILIDDSADEAFNVDVKKSSITLSDEAWNTINDKSYEYKRKSSKAWKRAGDLLSEKKGNEPNLQSNQIVEPVVIPEVIPGQPNVPNDIAEQVEREIISSMKKKIDREKDEKKRVDQKESGNNRDSSKIKTDEEYFEEALKGEANPYATKIFRVPMLDDNKLWEPYYDADHGHCVRINKNHRFARLVFEENAENADLQIIFELMLYQWAVSEIESFKIIKHGYKIKVDDLQNILDDFRRYTSDYLAHLVRQQESNLPPIKRS